MQKVTVWHGRDEVLALLREAVNRNCTCQDDKHACPAHELLIDQNVLDHLDFVYRVRGGYIWTEWRV